METGGAAVRAADIPRASLTVVLVDSTGYGWLPGQKLGDAAMDFRKCGGVETIASIVLLSLSGIVVFFFWALDEKAFQQKG